MSHRYVTYNRKEFLPIHISFIKCYVVAVINFFIVRIFNHALTHKISHCDLSNFQTNPTKSPAPHNATTTLLTIYSPIPCNTQRYYYATHYLLSNPLHHTTLLLRYSLSTLQSPATHNATTTLLSNYSPIPCTTQRYYYATQYLLSIPLHYAMLLLRYSVSTLQFSKLMH